MSDSNEKDKDKREEISKSSNLDDNEKVSLPIFTQTIMPPPTVLTPSSNNGKKGVQISPMPTSIYHQYYTEGGDYTIKPQMRIDNDEKITIVEIISDDDDDKGVSDEKIRNGKIGSLITCQINAWCNLVMLFGSFILLIVYFKSSVQSDYVIFAKVFIILFLVIELTVRIINLLQMRYYDFHFSFGDGVKMLLFKKESYLVFNKKWIEISQIIKLADTADNTCFIIPSLFLIHIIIFYIVNKEDSTDTSYETNLISILIEIILFAPSIILVMTRILFIIKTIDYAKKVDDDDDDYYYFDDRDINLNNSSSSSSSSKITSKITSKSNNNNNNTGNNNNYYNDHYICCGDNDFFECLGGFCGLVCQCLLAAFLCASLFN